MSFLRNFILSTLVILSCKVSAQNDDVPVDPKTYCDYKWQADSLYAAKDYKNALAVLNHCVELRRTNKDDYYRICLCYIKLNNDSDAVGNLKKAVDIGLYHWRIKEFRADSNLVKLQKSKYWKPIGKSIVALIEDVQADSIANRVLQTQLLKMVEFDQKYRAQAMTEQDPKAYGQLMKMQADLDSLNQDALKNMISMYGWPGITLVGRDGDQAAWMIVNHASSKKLDFLKYCLDHLQYAIEENDTDIPNAVALMDRVLVLSKKKQVYGTQYHEKKENGSTVDLIFEPIEDEANVDKRRHCLGLSTLEAYKSSVIKTLVR